MEKKPATYSPENTVIPLNGANQPVNATQNLSGWRVQLWRPDAVALTTKHTTGSSSAPLAANQRPTASASSANALLSRRRLTFARVKTVSVAAAAEEETTPVASFSPSFVPPRSSCRVTAPF